VTSDLDIVLRLRLTGQRLDNDAADEIVWLRRQLGEAKAKAYLAGAAVESMAAELDGLAAQIKNKAEQ
jgi:hypothetical protein